MAQETERTSIRNEIRIAVFWRQQIGDFEYIKFNPDDVLRWHLMLEERGPVEIEALMRERYHDAAPRTPVLGIVGQSPHPPAWIVRQWLSTKQPKFPKLTAIAAVCAWVVFSFYSMTALHGCADLRTLDKLAYRPPNPHPQLSAASNQVTVQTAAGTAPIATQSSGFGAPGSGGGGGRTSIVGPGAGGGTGPRSSGISGGASTGMTGPTSSGLSGGAPPP
jgi:hypothetical protein